MRNIFYVTNNYKVKLTTVEELKDLRIILIDDIISYLLTYETNIYKNGKYLEKKNKCTTFKSI